MIPKQETFDKAVSTLLKQGGPSVAPMGDLGQTEDGGTLCRFRSPSGRVCAIGALIPEGKYHPAFDGIRGQRAPEGGPLCVGDLVGDHDQNLRSDLRQAHDYSYTDLGPMEERTDENWLARFRLAARRIAENHGLSTAVLDEVQP